MSQVLSGTAPQRPVRLRLLPLATLPLSGFLVWAINTGGEILRWVFLGGLASGLVIPLFISFEAGLIALMLYEPNRGLLRRSQYIFLSYIPSDPIHLVSPLVTLLAFAITVQRGKLRTFRQTPLAWMITALAGIYVVQIFNPMQGGLSVGLSGALFVLVPVSWFYFGQNVRKDFLPFAFRLMVVVGIITSLYGLYQLTIGFPAFEQYWIDNTEFYDSISVGKIERAIATFSSAEEWARYIEIAAVVAFGCSTATRQYLRKAAWILCGIALTGFVLITGQRTAMFGLILGSVVILLLGARSLRGIATRMLIILVPALLVVVFVKAPTNDDMLEHGGDERVDAVLSHTARGTLRPTEEGSLKERLTNWTRVATEIIPNRPLGMGLGATSLGAYRYNAENMDLPPIDSHLISTAISCGVPTLVLLLIILGRATLISWRSYRGARGDSNESATWRTALAIMSILFLNNMFGNTLTLYSVAPICWLLVGWISTHGTNQQPAPTREVIEM